MGIDYCTYFAYGIILDETEDEYPMCEDDDDLLSFASYDYFPVRGEPVRFFGVSTCIACDTEDMEYSASDPQKWADEMKFAEREFAKTSLAARAKFFVFLCEN